MSQPEQRTGAPERHIRVLHSPDRAAWRDVSMTNPPLGSDCASIFNGKEAPASWHALEFMLAAIGER
jgi:hypothetical protein